MIEILDSFAPFHYGRDGELVFPENVENVVVLIVRIISISRISLRDLSRLDLLFRLSLMTLFDRRGLRILLLVRVAESYPIFFRSHCWDRTFSPTFWNGHDVFLIMPMLAQETYYKKWAVVKCMRLENFYERSDIQKARENIERIVLKTTVLAINILLSLY